MAVSSPNKGKNVNSFEHEIVQVISTVNTISILNYLSLNPDLAINRCLPDSNNKTGERCFSSGVAWLRPRTQAGLQCIRNVSVMRLQITPVLIYCDAL